MINVTRSFMPPMEEYEEKQKKIWENRWLTNEGPLLKQLQEQLEEYLGVNYVSMMTNGTISLQLALRALDIEDGEVITTPFSFVATTSCIVWEKCKPVFVDIDKDTLCIDVNKIEEAITDKTKAIMVVHVYGYPCDVEKIQEIANKHGLKVIYDGAHAFGSRYKGKSLLSYGDISTCSFHATKLFHTIEGGACITNNKEIYDKLQSIKNFGSVNGNYDNVGVNGKITEFNAAMGLANFKYIDKIIKERKEICETYDKLLEGKVVRPKVVENLEYNYIYYPIILKDEEETLRIIDALHEKEINPRRYFYPSLNTLSYIKDKGNCPISEDISKRVLCLPLYNGLSKEDVTKISNIVINNIK